MEQRRIYIQKKYVKLCIVLLPVLHAVVVKPMPSRVVSVSLKYMLVFVYAAPCVWKYTKAAFT